MNELKYSCGEDTQAAHAIKYLVIDIRADKKSNKAVTPDKVEMAFTRNGKQRSKVVYYVIDFTDSYESDINQIANVKYPRHHLLFLVPASIEDIFVRHPSDHDIDQVILKTALDSVKNRNYISVLDNGAKSFSSS